MDLRERVVAACDEKAATRSEIAEQFGVSQSWIRRLLQRRRECGSYAPLDGRRGRKPAFDAGLLARLERLVQQQPDATLQELRDRSGVRCSLVTVSNTLIRLGYRRKKRRFGPLSKIAPTFASSGKLGGSASSGPIADGSSISMKVGRKRT